MSNSDQNSHAQGQFGRAVWSLAALSVALFLCSVLAAKLIGDMVESGMAQFAAAVSVTTPVRKAAWGAVDPVATGSIQPKAAPSRLVATRAQAAK